MTKKENELRESCFALARGRIPAEKILAMADILAKEYDLPLERVGEIVRESVAVATSKDRNITKEVGEWIAQSEGTFRISDIYFDLAIGQGDKEAKNSVRVALARLKKEKIIESGSRHSGEYRKVVDECVKVDFLNAPIDPVFLKWPFELENVVNIFEKNIVVLAGKSNEGKTAFLLNFAKMNMDKFEVHYFSSEMGDSETRLRLTQFQDIKIEEWKINVWDRTEHFEDVIRPDAVNCIDYLESLTGEEYKVKAYISRIWNKLNKGIAVIAIQKNEQTDFGRGGQATMDKARLYLAINPGVIKIVKAKNWTDGENNPNGKIQTFKLIGGWKFVVDGLGWRTPDADDLAEEKTKYSRVHKYKNIDGDKP